MKVAAFAVLAGVALAVGGPVWKQADPGYRLAIPRDHASHPDYRIEWWYYTGNLVADDGRRFGYQVTFFRVGVDPAPANPSRWAVRDLYLAHFAVSDLNARRFKYADRLNRAGVGWAGAAPDRYRVWNEDWVASLDDSGHHRLAAAHGDIAIDLTLAEGTRFVPHGADGYSRKGASQGNASHYYSLTRMPTRGRIALGGRNIEVEGLSWMDHEFGTSFLEPGQSGWDWLSIQLDGGDDLMLYRLRRDDGRSDPHSTGTWVEADGRSRSLRLVDFNLSAGQLWTSPASGARYPVTWDVSIPSLGLRLEVRAAFPEQELRTERSSAVTYWEGAVLVSGVHEGRRVTGRGYLEMTGYGGRSLREAFR